MYITVIHTTAKRWSHTHLFLFLIIYPQLSILRKLHFPGFFFIIVIIDIILKAQAGEAIGSDINLSIFNVSDLATYRQRLEISENESKQRIWYFNVLKISVQYSYNCPSTIWVPCKGGWWVTCVMTIRGRGVQDSRSTL